MKAWTDFLKRLEERLGAPVVDQWLKTLKVAHFDAAHLYLEAQNPFQVQWFEEHIRPLLKKDFFSENGKPIKVHLTLGERSAVARPVSSPQKILPSFHVDRLDPLLTWDRFIFQEDNSALFAFFSELLHNPSLLPLGAFNPLYIWGESGAGKTHLLTALTFLLKEQGKSALYAKTETFTEHVVSAIRSSSMPPFRDHYRHVDILLIDDVHLLSSKYATQEEFFHTFNTLYSLKKQIIISSHCPPQELEQIEPRLVSRFEWGINLHLQPLPPAMLLQKKLAALHFPLTDEVCSFLLAQFSSIVPLQKALDTLILRSHLDKIAPEALTSSQAQTLLTHLIKAHTLSVDKIQSVVSAFYGINKEDLVSRSQMQEHSLPRQIAIFLCRKKLHLPFQTIGKHFFRDHSTIMTSVKQVEKKIEKKDPEYLNILAEIQKKLE